VVEQQNISPGGEPIEGAPRNPSSTPASVTAASSDPEKSDAAVSAPPNPQACVSTELTYSNLGHISYPTCGGPWRTSSEIAGARAYLLETASPGYTMMLQGPEVAISR